MHIIHILYCDMKMFPMFEPKKLKTGAQTKNWRLALKQKFKTGAQTKKLKTGAQTKKLKAGAQPKKWRLALKHAFWNRNEDTYDDWM